MIHNIMHILSTSGWLHILGVRQGSQACRSRKSRKAVGHYLDVWGLVFEGLLSAQQLSLWRYMPSILVLQEGSPVLQ